MKLASAEVARKNTGYQVSGTSPLGTRRGLPNCADVAIDTLDSLVINGEKRGFLVRISVSDLKAVLSPAIVDVCV